EGVREVRRLLEMAASEKRSPIPVSKIQLGLNCGGSDSFSGITANPALGACVDRLARFGGTAVLAETTVIFGAESLLLRRAVNREVADKLLECVRGYRRYLNQFGGSFVDNPSPGNKDGGVDEHRREVAGRGREGRYRRADGCRRLRGANFIAWAGLHQ